MINFKSVHLENLMSLGTIDLQLEDQGFVLVQGKNNSEIDNAESNGTGKSALFECGIVWILEGTTPRGTKDVVNKRMIEVGAYGELSLDYNGKDIRVIRAKNHTERGTSLTLIVNDEDVSSKNMKDTQVQINQYLEDITPTILSSVILLGQGLPSRFSSYTPSGRKTVLEELSKTSKSINELKSRVESRKAHLTDNAFKLDKEISCLQATRNANEIIIKERKLLESDKSSDIEKTIQENKQKIIEINNLLVSKKEYEIQLIKHIYDINLLIDECDEEKKALSDYIKQLESSKSSYKLGSCVMCNRPYDSQEESLVEIAKIDVNLEKVLKKHTEIIAKSKTVSNMLSVKNQELKEYETFVSNSNRDLLILSNSIDSLSDRKKYLSTIEKDIDNSTKIVTECTNSINGLHLKQGRITQELESINFISRSLSREFRGFLLKTVIDYINKRTKFYSKYLFESNSIKVILNSNNIDIKVNDKLYENLSGGERQKVDLAIQFSLRDMLISISGFRCNLLVLDEVFDNLDEKGCENLVNIIINSFDDTESIFIITHHNDINIPYDNILQLEKGTNNMSYIKRG